MDLKKSFFFYHHNLMKKKNHSKLSKNEPENIADVFVKGFKKLKIDF